MSILNSFQTSEKKNISKWTELANQRTKASARPWELEIVVTSLWPILSNMADALGDEWWLSEKDVEDTGKFPPLWIFFLF